MYKKLILLIILSGWSILVFSQQTRKSFYTSGDAEIDLVREEVEKTKTTRENYEVRLLLMKLWAVALQQQGVWLGEDYYQVDQYLNRVSQWNPVFKGGEAQVYTNKDMEDFAAIVQQGYAVLNKLQAQLAQDPASVMYDYKTDKQPLENLPEESEPIDWANYKANAQRTGYSGASGPVKGEIAWEFPVGLRWESKPVVEHDKVYLASPGMRNVLWTLDLNSGKVMDIATHVPKIKGDQLYSTPAMGSSPVVLDKHILLREMGSRGNKGISKNIIFINKQTGEIDKEIDAGHVDYRAGYVPMAANEQYLVYPYAIHDIEERPPLCQPFNRIICKSTTTGQKLWDFNIGPTFAEPVLDDKRIYTGTQLGMVFCLKANENHPSSSANRIAWEFQAEGAVNRKMAVADAFVYFGDNLGVIYCLDKSTGKEIWRHKVETVEPNAFRQFSTPVVSGEQLFIGCASSQLLWLNAKSGTLIDRYQTTDWIRSTPVTGEGFVYVAAMDGYVSKLSLKNGKFKEVWKKKIGQHFIYGDLVLAGDKLLFQRLRPLCLLSQHKIWRSKLAPQYHQKF